MSIQVITPATAEPLSLTEVKEFLRVDSSDEDATLNIMISAAREMCETYTRQILMTTTIDEVGDSFPAGNISLSRGPIQSITSVSYLDSAGATQTVASSDYTSDLISQPSRLDPVTSWPTVPPWPGTKQRNSETAISKDSWAAKVPTTHRNQPAWYPQCCLVFQVLHLPP